MKNKICLLATGLLATIATAQHAPPPADMRSSEIRRDALLGATVVLRPGESIENAVILMRDGVIEAVGTQLEIPNGYRAHDQTGLIIYPGLIETAVVMDVNQAQGAAASASGGHWNSRVTPQVSIADGNPLAASTRSQLRKLGFTTAQVLPENGILRGTGSVILLAEKDRNARALKEHSMLGASLDSAGWGGGSYPGSRMGAISLCRQTLDEAAWHDRILKLYEEDPAGLEPPEQSDALVALRPVLAGTMPVVFEVRNELDALRAAKIAAEFKCDAVLLGSGMEFRRLDEIAATKLPVVVPVNFPETPKVSDPWSADQVTLRELLTWKHAPENPRRLLEAGVPIALSTHTLSERSKFPSQIRKAIEAGLPHDEMLACLTTRPARMLGLEDVIGTIEPGKLANLVVVDGELFAKDAEIREVWVAGRRNELTPGTEFPLEGRFDLLVNGETQSDVHATLDLEKKRLVFFMPPQPAPEEEAQQKAEAEEGDGTEPAAEQPASEKEREFVARSVQLEPRRISFAGNGEPFGLDGEIRGSAVVVGGRLLGTLDTADGGMSRLELLASPEPPQDEAEHATESEEAQDDDAPTEPGKEDTDEASEVPSIEPLPVPLGAYGLLEPPRVRDVLVANATIWTCGDEGTLENTDMLVQNGRIIAIGTSLDAPENALVIDATGMHVTPGLIDCHSHTGISGGVNEGGQNNTAECRIGDVIDPDDINFYRQLAGGLTTANLLHGSANPIGGQNAVVKLRWGGTVEDMRFQGAKPGIKFALGENVKRGSGYPDTRMGIAAFITDAFRAAKEYRAAQVRYAESSPEEQARAWPPRPDYELDAIAEIIAGDRIIHCHSYRQDEILMLLRLCEQYGITIGTLQHVLEGYKVAEAIARHGAGASSFSDWWAYKMEVMDAIPYNGALMNDVGVLVSFNSDSDELARRMNDEAAKAIRWGGMSQEDALRFVTLNPARQLRIDDRVGSLELGKDADFAIWNKNPLSSYSLCEETWVDGARQFSRAHAAESHANAVLERGELITLATGGGKEEEQAGGDRPRGAGPPPGVERRRRRPTRMLARLLLEREDALLEKVHRGLDPEAAEPAACGCGTGSLVELARTLAREQEDAR